MIARNTYEGIDKDTADLIRHKSHQLVGKAGFMQDDRADIEQELMLDLLKRMKHFDPAKAKKSTFMSRIVEHRISTMLESRHAACRDWRMCRESLNDPIGEGDEAFGERIENVTSPTEFFGELHMDCVELRQGRGLDQRCSFDSMPEDLRDICERLRGSTIAEVVQDLKIPRSTLYGKIRRIREIFKSTKIQEYLPTHSVPLR